MKEIRELTWVDLLEVDGTVEDVLAKVRRPAGSIFHVTARRIARIPSTVPTCSLQAEARSRLHLSI